MSEATRPARRGDRPAAQPPTGLRYRWLVTDLDGTLVGRDHRTVARSVAALHRYRAAGGTVVLATGRNESAAAPFHRELELRTPMILYNGARIVDPVRQRVLYDRHLGDAWPLLRDAVLPVLPAGVGALAFTGTERYVVADDPALDGYTGDRPLPPPGAPPPGPVTKAMFVSGRPGADAGPLPLVRELVARHAPDVTAVHSESTYLEVLPPGVSKGTALAALAETAGVALEEVAAIGDNPNDAEMLAAAGLGAAVGDGHPRVRAGADLVVGRCADGAVADLVDHLLAA